MRCEGGYYSNSDDTSTGSSAPAGLGGLLLIELNASQHQPGANQLLSCIWPNHLKMEAKHMWRQSGDCLLQSLPRKQRLYPVGPSPRCSTQGVFGGAWNVSHCLLNAHLLKTKSPLLCFCRSQMWFSQHFCTLIINCEAAIYFIFLL